MRIQSLGLVQASWRWRLRRIGTLGWLRSRLQIAHPLGIALETLAIALLLDGERGRLGVAIEAVDALLVGGRDDFGYPHAAI